MINLGTFGFDHSLKEKLWTTFTISPQIAHIVTIQKREHVAKNEVNQSESAFGPELIFVPIMAGERDAARQSAAEKAGRALDPSDVSADIEYLATRLGKKLEQLDGDGEQPHEEADELQAAFEGNVPWEKGQLSFKEFLVHGKRGIQLLRFRNLEGGREKMEIECADHGNEWILQIKNRI